MDVNGRDVNGAARHRAVLRYIAKRHKVSAKINTLHNARKRKRFPNANLMVGFLPLITSTNKKRIDYDALFVWWTLTDSNR